VHGRPEDSDGRPAGAGRAAKAELELIEFADQAAWEAWLEANGASVSGVWLKFAKKSAPHSTIVPQEAIQSALCFGWIDGQAGSIDEHFYSRRFTPRRPRGRWSLINTQWAEELISAGRMRPAGLAEVEAARADGRWQAAYSQARDEVPADLQAAIDADPQAKAFFATISSQNRFALIFRVGDAKRPETRARRIAQFVEMLAAGQTLH
jgi:uncharacterized protein YdeI (YjbR/CyaY-like superfamily)